MKLETERMILRPWAETDAADLYEVAKDDRVGPIAGWPPHSCAEESADIIRTVFNLDEVYATELKANGRAVGCIGILIGENSNFDISQREGKSPTGLVYRTRDRSDPGSGQGSDAPCIRNPGAGCTVVRLF